MFVYVLLKFDWLIFFFLEIPARKLKILDFLSLIFFSAVFQMSRLRMFGFKIRRNFLPVQKFRMNGKRPFTFHTVFYCLNILKLSCKPLAFTSYKTFLKETLELVSLPPASFSGYSLCYILLLDQISLPVCLYLLRYWAIRVFQLFPNQVLTSWTLELTLFFLSSCFFISTVLGLLFIVTSEALSEPNQTSKMKFFTKIYNDFQPLTIFPKKLF